MLIIPIRFCAWSQWNWDRGNCLKWKWWTQRRTPLISPRAPNKCLRTCTECSKYRKQSLYCGPQRCLASTEFGFFNINENYRWERGLAKTWLLLLTVIAMQASTVAGLRAQYHLCSNVLFSNSMWIYIIPIVMGSVVSFQLWLCF